MISGSDSDRVIDQFVHKFPLHELYRLFYRFFVNGKRYYQSWLPGEQTEPGFLISCTCALLYELDHLHEPLSVDVVERIHKNVINNVLNTNYTEEDFEQGKTSFRTQQEYVGFGLIPGRNLSEDGFKELSQEQQSTPYSYHVSMDEKTKKYYRLLCMSDKPLEDAKEIIDIYNKAIARVNDRDNIIRIIIRLVKSLERLHPYRDGNCRSFGLITLNRELVRKGLPMSILDDPNQFDGFSEDELFKKVIEGQKRYTELVTTGQMETPFRSGMLYDAVTSLELSHDDLLLRDSLEFDKLVIDDKLEFDKNLRPFLGQDQNSYELLLLRLIVETALNKALKDSSLSGVLLTRLKHKDKAIYNTIFYDENLNQTIYNYIQEQKDIYILMLALKFGAESVFEAVSYCCQRDPQFLRDNSCQTDMGAISLIGYCVFAGRHQFAQKLATMVESPDALLTMMRKDIQAALKLKDIKKVLSLIKFFSKSSLHNDPRVSACVDLASKHKQAVNAKAQESFFPSWLLRDPATDLEEKIRKAVGSLCVETMPVSKKKNRI